MLKYLFPILMIVSFYGIGQKKEYKRFETRPINEEYIVDYSDQLSIKLYGILKSNQINHVNHQTEDKLEYKPNENFNIGFGFGYKWVGVDLAFNLPGVNDDDDKFGKTRRFDIQSSIYTRKFAIDLIFQRYKGYYLVNPDKYIPGFDPDGPFPQRPDMRTLIYGASALYIFKHDKFSYRSAFTYNERQIKSAGSFIAGPFLTYFRMDADSSLIISEAESAFDTSQDFRGSEYIKYGISGGYAHTFVIGKRVFFSLSLAIGLGPEIKKTPAINGNRSSVESKFTGRLSSRTALGYNSEKFYAGLAGVSFFSGERDEDEDYLERSVNHVKIFIGKRFDPPKFLKKL